MLRWPDERAKTDAWTAFLADTEWADIKRAIGGNIVGWIEDRLLVTTDYSPPFA